MKCNETFDAIVNRARLYGVQATLIDRLSAAHKRKVEHLTSCLSGLELRCKYMEGQIAELKEALRRVIVIAENRQPSQPTIDEIETLMNARAALEKTEGGAK